MGCFNHQPVMEIWAIFFSDLLVEVTVSNCSFFVRERTSMSASPYKKNGRNIQVKDSRIHCPDTCTRTYSNYRYVYHLRYKHIFVTFQTKKPPYWRGTELLHPRFGKCRTEMMRWAQMSKAEWPDLSTYTHGIHGTGIFTYTWMIDFHGINVGKYSSPMDRLGHGQQLFQISFVTRGIFFFKRCLNWSASSWCCMDLAAKHGIQIRNSVKFFPV